MKYIFNKIENIEISNNCFLGSFVNMLKYYGITVNEEQVQLLYGGIKLKVLSNRDIALQSNFEEAVFSFCQKNNILYKEKKLSSSSFIKEVTSILNDYGVCVGFFCTKLFDYNKCFNNDRMGKHCVTINGIDENGLYIIDSYVAAATVTSYEGILPFKNIYELIIPQSTISIGYIENKDIKLNQNDETNIKKELIHFMKDNINKTFGSRVERTEYYIENIKNNFQLSSEMIKDISYNIAVVSHIPQIHTVMRLIKKEKNFFNMLDIVCKQWTVLSYKLLKESYKDNEKQTLVLLDNYLKLIEEEKNIYSLYLEENYE